MTRKFLRFITSFLAAALVTTHAATAHPGHVPHDFGGGGTAEPRPEIDLVLATLVLGLSAMCAMHLRGRARWLLPAVFVASVAFCGALHVVGFHTPMLEIGLVASAITFGALRSRSAARRA